MPFILNYACGRGHEFGAYTSEGEPICLEGMFCPVCLGTIKGAGEMIDPRFLAPMQNSKQVLAVRVVPTEGGPYADG
jgi:hypothetical protein